MKARKWDIGWVIAYALRGVLCAVCSGGVWVLPVGLAGIIAVTLLMTGSSLVASKHFVLGAMALVGLLLLTRAR